VGNFPQALSHISLVHAAFTMSGDWTPTHADADRGGGGNSAKATAKGATKGR